MTKADEDHKARLREMGCIVCRLHLHVYTPAVPHHLREQTGAALRASDLEAIPLCPPHHQFADGTAKFHGEIGYHFSPETFERRYGTQRELLNIVTELLNQGGNTEWN